MPITPTTIMLIKLITDMIISLGTTLKRVDSMTEEEMKSAIENTEQMAALLQKRQDDH